MSSPRVTGLSVLVQVFVRCRFSGLRGEEHDDVLRFAAGVIGLVFALEAASGVQLASRLHVFYGMEKPPPTS